MFDIAVMEELEFAVRPMTHALEKRECVLSKNLAEAKHFKEPNDVTWKVRVSV